MDKLWWWWWAGQNPNTSFGNLSVGILSVGIYSAHHENDHADHKDDKYCGSVWEELKGRQGGKGFNETLFVTLIHSAVHSVNWDVQFWMLLLFANMGKVTSAKVQKGISWNILQPNKIQGVFFNWYPP